MRAPVPLVAMTVLAALTRGQDPGERRPSFPAGVELVTVDVVVVDREGAPVRGLRAEDFTLEEDGRPQALAAFEAVDRPPAAAARTDARPSPPPRVSSNRGASTRAARVFVIVFDDLHLDAAEAQRAREAVAGFLEGAFAGGDRVSLVTTSGDAWWHTRMPEGGDALRSILPRLRGRARVADSMKEGMTDYEALRIDRDHDPLVTGHVTRRWKAAATDILSLREDDTVGERVTATAARIGLEVERRNQEALDVLARAFASGAAVRGRKAVLLVSGGFVHDPRLAEFRRALGESRRANAALYFVDARGLAALGPAQTAEAAAPTDLQDTSLALGALGVGAEGSESLAAETGGFSIRNRNDLAAGAQDDPPRVLELLPAGLRTPGARQPPLPPDRGAGGARGRAGANAKGLLPGRGRDARARGSGRGPPAGLRLALRPRRDPAPCRRSRLRGEDPGPASRC